jgi:hypothetical protein
VAAIEPANPDRRLGRVVSAAGSLPWWPAVMSPIRLPASDVPCLRGRVDVFNPTFGRSALSRAPSVLAAASNAASSAATSFADGAKLPGIVNLKQPCRLVPETVTTLVQSWKSAQAGPFNAGHAQSSKKEWTSEP